LKYWEIIADNLRARGYSVGWKAVSTSNGQHFIADARAQTTAEASSPDTRRDRRTHPICNLGARVSCVSTARLSH